MSPAINDRDRRVREEASAFCTSKSNYPLPCNSYTPTLEELETTPFSDYVRMVVLRRAERDYDAEYEAAAAEAAAAAAAAAAAKRANSNNNNIVKTPPHTHSHNTRRKKIDVISLTKNKNIDDDDDGNNSTKNSNASSAALGRSLITSGTRPLKTVRELVACSTSSNGNSNRPIEYTEGMARVTLPKEFRDEFSRVQDVTGRGDDFNKGTPLGDIVIPSPIKQCVRGIGGIYEYTFLDQPPITAAEFRDKADDYLRQQLGASAVPPRKPTMMSPPTPVLVEQDDNISNNCDANVDKDSPTKTSTVPTEETSYSSPLSIDELERRFWKRLGPTMSPAMYGADMEGSLFNEKEDRIGWNISKLSSCLQLLLSDEPDDDEKEGIPGVTTPYLYFGMWASVFCTHTEDMNLLSINYLHAGAPKVWYAVAAGKDSQRLEQLCEGHYHQARTQCPEYMRHKRCLISPGKLKKAGIPFTKTVQYPGDAMITFPGSYHFGFNTGFNIAEATNFAVPEWMPYGRIANICLCRPDSVRIDMNKFERLILQYDKQTKRSRLRPRMSWKEWAIRLRKRKQKRDEDMDRRLSSSRGNSNGGVRNGGNHDSPRGRKPFWVEVMQPLATKSPAANKKNLKTSKKQKRKSRKRTKDESIEVWHLAKPGGRKSLRPDAKVLCITPATVDEDDYGSHSDADNSDEDSEPEECFAGVITEVRDNHVRVRLDGLTKKDDVWMPIDSPKLFLDGGKWDGTPEGEALPPKHYWREEDSKRRCK